MATNHRSVACNPLGVDAGALLMSLHGIARTGDRSREPLQQAEPVGALCVAVACGGGIRTERGGSGPPRPSSNYVGAVGGQPDQLLPEPFSVRHVVARPAVPTRCVLEVVVQRCRQRRVDA